MTTAGRYDGPLAALAAASRPDRPAPEAMRRYLEKVRTEAYRVTDRDVEELLEAGFSEDEVFEHTVSAAVDQGLARFRAGLEALR